MDGFHLFILIITLVMFGLTVFSFSFEKMAKFYVPLSILAVIVVLFSSIPTIEDPESTILGFIEFKALIFIFSMSIIVNIIEEEKIFQYIAIHLIRATRGNARKMFYVLCTITTLIAAIIADVTVSIIFAPLIIRVCRVLDINPTPYLLGMTININLGSLITPFGSSENIIIAAFAGEIINGEGAAGLGIDFFIQNTWLFFAVALVLTLLFLDMFMVRKRQVVSKDHQDALVNLLAPSIVVDKENVRKFRMNFILMFAIFAFIIILPEAYIPCLIGAVVLILANKRRFQDVMKAVEWEVLFFFVSLFIMIGVLQDPDVGFLVLIGDWFIGVALQNGMGAVILVFVISSALSAVISNAPVALLFLPILASLASQFPALSIPLVVALLLGINIGGNFLPQGAECDIMTLTLAKRNNVKDFTYAKLFKVGGSFALLHFLLSIAFLLVLMVFLAV